MWQGDGAANLLVRFSRVDAEAYVQYDRFIVLRGRGFFGER
jgi:hypothetical protein